MSSAPCRVVLFGNDSGFFEYAAYHFAAAGVQTLPVVTTDELDAALAEERPLAVLLHWDTLGDACLRACTFVKARHAVPVAVLSERLTGGANVVSAFASGADACIEGAQNPRILMQRIRSWIPGLCGIFTNASPALYPGVR